MEQLFHECVGKQKLEKNTLLESENFPVLNQVPEIERSDVLEVEVMLESSVVEEIPETLDYYGEFYLELDEWRSIYETNLNEETTLNKNWTNLLEESFMKSITCVF